MKGWRFKGFDIVSAKKDALSDITKYSERNYVLNTVEDDVLKMCEIYNPVVVGINVCVPDAIKIDPYEFFDYEKRRDTKRYCVKCGELKKNEEFDFVCGGYRELCKDCAQEYVETLKVKNYNPYPNLTNRNKDRVNLYYWRKCKVVGCIKKCKMRTYNSGDKIIIETDSGYELGYFVGQERDLGIITVRFVTGKHLGVFHVYKSDVLKYCEANINYEKMLHKYELQFPETEN